MIENIDDVAKAMDSLGSIVGNLIESFSPLIKSVLNTIKLDQIALLIDKFPIVSKLLKANLDADALQVSALLKNEKLVNAVTKLISENKESLAKFMINLDPYILTEILNGNPKLLPVIVGDIHPKMMSEVMDIMEIANRFFPPKVIFGNNALERSKKIFNRKRRTSSYSY